MEHICGRPLGMRLHPELSHRMIVADAYMGLLQVNLNSRKVKTLVNASEHHFPLINDLDVSSEGIVYFSNTGKYPRNQIHRNLVEAQPTGSVWTYNLHTGELKVLAPNLVMPNGVQLTGDSKHLLVPSTVLSSLYKISTETGEVKIVNNDLQGTPDNIRAFRRTEDGKVTFSVALGSKRSSPFSLPQLVAPFLSLRKVLGMLDLTTTTALIPKAGIFVEVDENGKELTMFQDKSAKSNWYSEIECHKGYCYIGSWCAPLARVKANEHMQHTSH